MPTNETILILGASARAAAFSALRAGFVPHCADMFADADLQALAAARAVADFPRGLPEAARALPSGPWLYTGGLENHPRLVDRLAGERMLLGNAGRVLRRVRDPRLVASAIARAGLPCPRVALLPDGLPRDGSWLAKPRRSAGGKNVAGLTPRWQRAGGERRWYFQQRIEGQPIAAVYLATGDRASFLGATEQLIGPAWGAPAEFSYAGSIGPLPLTSHEAAACAQIGQVLTAEFGIRGLFGVDAVRNAAGIWPVEVNPRYPASAEVLERVGGVSLVAAHAASSRGQSADIGEPTAGKRWAGKLILYARRQETAGAELTLSLLSQRGGDPLLPLVADIPRFGTPLFAGWPMWTLLADGGSREEVADALRARAALSGGGGYCTWEHDGF